jgi:hypothetical protein
MTLDYKTLQAMTGSQPAKVSSYCPECGRAWIDTSPQPPQWATSFPWRAALLSVLGLALAITFGHRAVSLVEARSSVCDMAEAVLSRTVCPAPANPSPGDWLALWASLGQSAMTQGEIRRDLAVTIGAVATTLVGIGALNRPSFRARASRGTALVRAAWVVGETLCLVVSLPIVAFYADLVIVRLSLGWPPTWWEALDSVTDQVSALLFIVTDLR